MTVAIVTLERHDLKAVYMEAPGLGSEEKRKCSLGSTPLGYRSPGINRWSIVTGKCVKSAYLTPGLEGMPLSPGVGVPSDCVFLFLIDE